MLARIFALSILLVSSSAFAQGWSPNTIPIVSPSDYGATHNCTADDQVGLTAAINALPASGGILFMSPGGCVQKNDKLTISKAHVKLWCEAQNCTLYGRTNNVDRKQTVNFTADGGGVYGLRMTSDANVRKTALEDHFIAFSNTTGNEVVGVDMSNSAGAGIFSEPSYQTYIEGNHIHDTWADTIHFTGSSRGAWVWDNFISNDASNPVQHGDDGVACVTYGAATSPRTGDIEVWSNVIRPTRWGRGVTAVGCESFDFHDNMIFGTAGAGIYIASEGAPFNTAAAANGTVTSNWTVGCGHTIGHQGILVYSGAGAVSNIAFTNNTSFGTAAGAYFVSGTTSGITSTGLVSAEPGSGTPALPPVATRSTLILKMRDASFAPVANRTGLYRIHVRRPSSTCVGSTSCFEMRFEYLIKGDPGRVAAWSARQQAVGATEVDRRTIAGAGYALVLSPVSVPLTPWTGLSGVTFDELRTPALSAVWGKTQGMP